jgi:hypothetical protein
MRETDEKNTLRWISTASRGDEKSFPRQPPKWFASSAISLSAQSAFRSRREEGNQLEPDRMRSYTDPVDAP